MPMQCAFTPILIVALAGGSVVTMPHEEKNLAGVSLDRTATKARLLEDAKLLKAPGFEGRALALPRAGVKEATHGRRVELARQMDTLYLDLTAAWLTRGLEDERLPDDVAERLGERGVTHRKSVLSHLDAIASMTILDVKTILDVTRKSNRPSRPVARNRTDRANESPMAEDQIDVISHIPLSLKFSFVPRRNIKDIVNVTHMQEILSSRLHVAVMNMVAYWTGRNYTARQFEEGLPDRVVRHRQAIEGHLDAVLFEMILTPQQSELFKRAFWTTLGLKGLLDPELASRLRITKDQRAIIEEAVAHGARVNSAAREELSPMSLNVLDPVEVQKAMEAKEIIKLRTEEAQQAGWDVLSPKQIAKIKNMLGEKALKPAAPMKDRSTKRPRRAS